MSLGVRLPLRPASRNSLPSDSESVSRRRSYPIHSVRNSLFDQPLTSMAAHRQRGSRRAGGAGRLGQRSTRARRSVHVEARAWRELAANQRSESVIARRRLARDRRANARREKAVLRSRARRQQRDTAHREARHANTVPAAPCASEMVEIEAAAQSSTRASAGCRGRTPEWRTRRAPVQPLSAPPGTVAANRRGVIAS